jgi:hypothetical protein
MQTINFFTLSSDGVKKPLATVEVEGTKKLLRIAVAKLRVKARDIADFLHMRGNHLYLYTDKVIME